jgi:hypothetical protein
MLEIEKVNIPDEDEMIERLVDKHKNYNISEGKEANKINSLYRKYVDKPQSSTNSNKIMKKEND